MLIEEDDISPPLTSNIWTGSPTASSVTAIHGAHLMTEDIENLRNLITEFCLRALIPYAERQMQVISETVSNKKGVSRSIFSATKRWFAPSKPGASSNSSTPFNSIVYVKFVLCYANCLLRFCLNF